MERTSEILFAIGCLFFLGLATDFLGRRTSLPRVTLLLLFGIVIGVEFLNLIPTEVTSQFELIGNFALLMIGFLLGGKLTLETFKQSGAQMLWISILPALGTALIVLCGLLLIGVPLEVAILLGCISSATAPAATIDVVVESGARGPFANLIYCNQL